MYETHYGFTDRPFNMTPDSDFFFASSKHEEALNRLLLAISERNGFAIITGEIGSGKTTICRTLLNRLDPTTKVALVLNTHLGKKELLTTILEDLDIEYSSTSKTRLLSALNKYLIEQVSRDINVVLIIDEAQNLTPSVLEEVRMLSNLETEKEKLIQIILLGQPELRKKLLTPKLEQFSQRIVLYYHLEPLDYVETKRYIQHRLEKAGCKQKDIFSVSAINEIYKYSNGIPRLINLACHNALISGLVANLKQIDGNTVTEAVGDLTHHRGYAPSSNMITQDAMIDSLLCAHNSEPKGEFSSGEKTPSPLSLGAEANEETATEEPIFVQEILSAERFESPLLQTVLEEPPVNLSLAAPETDQTPSLPASPPKVAGEAISKTPSLRATNGSEAISQTPSLRATNGSEAISKQKKRLPSLFAIFPLLFIIPVALYLIISPKMLRDKTIAAKLNNIRSYEKLISNGVINGAIVKNASYNAHTKNENALLGEGVNLADTKTPAWTRITFALSNPADLSKANLLIRAKSASIATSMSLLLTDMKGNVYTSSITLSPRWEWKSVMIKTTSGFDMTKVSAIAIEYTVENNDSATNNQVYIKEIGVRRSG